MDDPGPSAVATSGDRSGQPDVRRKLDFLALVDEFAPLYALFTLWFNGGASR